MKAPSGKSKVRKRSFRKGVVCQDTQNPEELQEGGGGCRQSTQPIMKERGELDKKIQSCIEVCLADITSHKSKQQNDGGLIVKEMSMLIPVVYELQQ